MHQRLHHRLPPTESIPLRRLSLRWAETTITPQKEPEKVTRARLSMSKQVLGNTTQADLRVRARLVQVVGIVGIQTCLCLNLPGAENQPEILPLVLPHPPSCRRLGSGTSPLLSTCASSAQQVLTEPRQTLRGAGGCSQATGASMRGISSSTQAVARVTTCEAGAHPLQSHPNKPNCQEISGSVLAV